MVYTDQREIGNAYRERDRLRIKNDYPFILDYHAKIVYTKLSREIISYGIDKIIARNYQLVYFVAKVSDI